MDFATARIIPLNRMDCDGATEEVGESLEKSREVLKSQKNLVAKRIWTFSDFPRLP
jgi:hypothetical protein